MHKTFAALVAATTLALLTACGGGGSDSPAASGNTNNPSPSPTTGVTAEAQIVANVQSSNIAFLPGNRPAGTWRWSGTPAQSVQVYIPTPTAGSTTEQDYAAKNMV